MSQAWHIARKLSPYGGACADIVSHESPSVDPSQMDIVDESIDLFRANSLFRNFEIKGPADRVRFSRSPQPPGCHTATECPRPCADISLCSGSPLQLHYRSSSTLFSSSQTASPRLPTAGYPCRKTRHINNLAPLQLITLRCLEMRTSRSMRCMPRLATGLMLVSAELSSSAVRTKGVLAVS